MPTYNYKCSDCGAEIEAVQKMSEAPLKTCPTCSKDTLDRIISPGVGFILRGTGWFKDGYGNSSGNNNK
jgi:putative FmdB family regulatory protein